jgi:hypothetical protein
MSFMRYGRAHRLHRYFIISYGPSEGLRPPQDDKVKGAG